MVPGNEWLEVVATDPPATFVEGIGLKFKQNTQGVRLQIKKVGAGPLSTVIDLFGWIPDKTNPTTKSEISGDWTKFQRITLTSEHPCILLPITGDFNYIADFDWMTFKRVSGDDVQVRFVFTEFFQAK